MRSGKRSPRLVETQEFSSLLGMSAPVFTAFFHRFQFPHRSTPGSNVGGKLTHGLERSVDLGLAIIDLARLPNA
jgi:hypothetical protein